ncbi:MAG: aminotransferase class I/II-fold pyridoxal phosphate-dependent enzyme, partial [Spirochaetia bacterium]|nr:aminotransferase class I/II-fold pyridoxal phosphate-dependent enzyme [Spirochaetia bacterium]
AFYVFVNIKKLPMNAMDFASYLLDDAGVATVPGTAFGTSGEGYIRLSCASSYENLEEACYKIESAVAKLGK